MRMCHCLACTFATIAGPARPCDPHTHSRAPLKLGSQQAASRVPCSLALTGHRYCAPPAAAAAAAAAACTGQVGLPAPSRHRPRAAEVHDGAAAAHGRGCRRHCVLAGACLWGRCQAEACLQPGGSVFAACVATHAIVCICSACMCCPCLHVMSVTELTCLASLSCLQDVSVTAHMLCMHACCACLHDMSVTAHMLCMHACCACLHVMSVTAAGQAAHPHKHRLESACPSSHCLVQAAFGACFCMTVLVGACPTLSCNWELSASVMVNQCVCVRAHTVCACL